MWRGCATGSSASIPSWRSRSRKAASRTTRCCSAPNSLMPVPGPIRIVLVEDNSVFREALELLLGLRSGLKVVASVADGTDAVPAVLEHDPDVVVMDYRLPGLDGVQATRAVR